MPRVWASVKRLFFITLPFTSFYLEQYFSQVCATSFLIWAILKKFFKQVEVRILLSARMT
jgi:hypothetical protein